MGAMYYSAVGFSLDDYMGDDTVLTCFGRYSPLNLTSNQRPGNVLISWNDHYDNYILFQASEAIITTNQVGVSNSRFQCSGFWNFNRRKNIAMDPERTYDLGDPNNEWHILFARGTADPYTYDLDIHSTHDGDGFPWITHDTINFCTDQGCGQNFVPYKILSDAHQSYILREIKQKVAVAHGEVMFICWWVLVSTGILIARFGKNYDVKIFGATIWFQIHRTLMFLAFSCITVVFFLIYWQRGWRVIDCSTECSLDDYNAQIHAILGTVTYSLLIFQVLTGILRPGLDSPIRPYFNLIHRFNGVLVWTGASITMFLGADMGKTGLRSTYQGWPYFIMSMVVIIFVLTYGLSKFMPQNSNSVEKLKLDRDDPEKRPSHISTFLIFANSLVAIAGTIAIGIMFGKVLKKFGY